MANSKFDHKAVEAKWQKRWEDVKTLYPDEMLPAENKFYNLWMFPYPSAEGLHAGHAFTTTGSDVYGRFQRMNGKNVFQPTGYDSFGIHSENYAIKINDTPQSVVERTTKNYTRQLKSLGHGYDWTRTVTTSDTDYYRWTQWLFVQLFKAGLAYRKKAQVNWCPSCKTVLADEQVMTPAQAEKEPKDAQGNIIEDTGDLHVCERCGTVVEKKDLEQWFFRITDYADRLLDNLEKIEWSERVEIAQRNWIGRSQGAKLKFKFINSDENIEVFTTALDTIFGVTFMVVSFEQAKKLLEIMPEENKSSVIDFIEKNANQDIKQSKEKLGVDTGLKVINPFNGEEIPIWVANYVLDTYGTGAVMGVPGHDERDHEFAQKYILQIKPVVRPTNEELRDEVGDDGFWDYQSIKINRNNTEMFDSGEFNGMNSGEALEKMLQKIERENWGEKTTNYHLRDWLISRQRYWGPPIPMIYCEQCAESGKSWFTSDEAKNSPSQSKQFENWNLKIENLSAAMKGWWPDENLPVQLPDIEDFKPKGDGRGPLADHPEFYEIKCPYCGADARRETDVSDTFLDSAWYFLAYPLQNTDEWKKSPSTSSGHDLLKNKIIESWLPVDLYFGGAEHAVLHLMYARFVTQVLYDLGYLSFEEPFPKFFAHGLMIKDGAKMSKSRGNVVNPDEYIEKFGADTLRLYLMFMGPMDGYPDFRDTGIEGMRRFVEKLWGLFNSLSSRAKPASAGKRGDLGVDEIASSKSSLPAGRQARNDELDLDVKMHETMKRVTEDIKVFKNNTAIAAIMEYVNALRASISNSQFSISKHYLEVLALLINPFAPHLAEEAWELLGQEFSIQKARWPEWDERKLVSDVVEVMVQVNGKLRGQVSIESSKIEDQEYIAVKARKDEQIIKWLQGENVKKEIYIPGKVINFVL